MIKLHQNFEIILFIKCYLYTNIKYIFYSFMNLTVVFERFFGNKLVILWGSYLHRYSPFDYKNESNSQNLTSCSIQNFDNCFNLIHLLIFSTHFLVFK